MVSVLDIGRILSKSKPTPKASNTKVCDIDLNSNWHFIHLTPKSLALNHSWQPPVFITIGHRRQGYFSRAAPRPHWLHYGNAPCQDTKNYWLISTISAPDYWTCQSIIWLDYRLHYTGNQYRKSNILRDWTVSLFIKQIILNWKLW